MIKIYFKGFVKKSIKKGFGFFFFKADFLKINLQKLIAKIKIE